MISILIADSNTAATAAYKAFLKHNFTQLKTINTISDPHGDMMEAVKKTRPQLIIGEISFFGFSGFLVMRNIYELYPDIRFIVYGGYNEASYIEKSLEYGVLDYLYKPINYTYFQRSIEKALQHFEKSAGNKKKESELAGSYLQRKGAFEDILFASLLKGHILNEDEIQHSFKYFNRTMHPPYVAFIVHIDHFKKVILTLDEMEKHMLTYKITLEIERKIKALQAKDVYGKVFISSLSSICVVMGGAFANTKEEMVSFCNSIKNALFDELDVRVTIGIGRSYQQANQLSISYREAEGALLYRFLMGYNTVIHIDYAEPQNSITYQYPVEKEQRLIYAAAIGEYRYCMQLLRELFDALKESQPLPEKYLSKIVMSLIIGINRYLSEQNVSTHSAFTSFFPSREALELKDDIEEAFEYLSTHLRNFCAHIAQLKQQSSLELIVVAKEYLRQKFRGSFSLQEMAAYMNITPVYLNRIFQEEVDMTVFEYALHLRLEEAKKLLRETDLTEEIIALKVGYESGRYFKAIFKRQEGISTRDYRQANSEEDSTKS